MKKSILLFLIVIAQSLYGQWIPTNSAPSTNLKDIYCVTENLVFAVGNNGTILKTPDGGNIWVFKTSGTNFNLEKVRFVDANIGFALGKENNTQNGIFIKTIDGGTTWTNIMNFVSTNNGQGDFTLVSANIIYFSNNGALSKSIDGGAIFQTINSSQFIQKIQFFNELKGFANNYFTLLKTVDGGLNWTEIGNVDFFNGNSLFNFVTENIGFKKINNQILKTIDGGNSYTFLSSINHLVGKIYASTENVLWTVSVEVLLNGQPNFITRIETNNLNFVSRIDSSGVFRSVHFASPTKGFGVLYGGPIFKNITGTMLSTNNSINDQKIKIYPNPTSIELNIAFSQKQFETFDVEIVDNSGKKVFYNQFQPVENIKINTESFAKGIYFLTISTKDSKQTQKIVVQ